MADAYDALVTVRKKLSVRRQMILERMAMGGSEDRYQELVGRARAYVDIIELLNEHIKLINKGDGDGES